MNNNQYTFEPEASQSNFSQESKLKSAHCIPACLNEQFQDAKVGYFGNYDQVYPTHDKFSGTKNYFAVSLEDIVLNQDSRTTLMIRNIPNKYTQKMLLERIDRLHAERYDFFYLPMDLKNNCNVGYAFINFVDPVFIMPFFEDMNDRSWEKFNSEKICEITYGRIQGKAELVEHFSLSEQTRKVKPVIFQRDYSFLRSFAYQLRSRFLQKNQKSTAT